MLNSFSRAALFSDIFFAFSFRSASLFNTRWGGREVSGEGGTGDCGLTDGGSGLTDGDCGLADGDCGLTDGDSGLATDCCGLAVVSNGIGTEIAVIHDLNLLPALFASVFTWLLAFLLLQTKKPTALRRRMQRRVISNPPVVAKPWDELS